MNNSQLKLLRKLLPKGYRKRIHKETGFSYPHIDFVLKGERYNQQIIDCAVYIFEESLQAKKQSVTRFENILNEFADHGQASFPIQT